MIKLCVDLKGADNNEELLIYGAINALKNNDDLFLYIFADKDKIENIIKNENITNYEIIDSKDEITNDDIPMMAFKKKKESSLIKALTFCKENDDVSGVVTLGSTGSVLFSSVFIIGTIRHLRPCLCPILKGTEDYFCLVDCGANVDMKEEQLFQFAKMGVAFMQARGIDNPKVALLSNGKEEKKGNDVTRAAYQLLKNSNLNFIGNFEGYDILNKEVHVVVADGFQGNIALKSIEGTAHAIIMKIKEEALKIDSPMKSTLLDIIDNITKQYDYNTQGGAVMLGLKKIIVKGHGMGNENTINAIINECYDLAKADLINKIKINLEDK
jgi:glycerol-3-phosphate acyltransferase PlsX